MKFNSNLLFEKGLGRFYHIVYLLTALSLTGGIYSLFLMWNVMNPGGKISSISGCCITLLFCLLFKYLRDTASKQTNLEESNLKSTQDLIKIMEGGKNEKGIETSG